MIATATIPAGKFARVLAALARQFPTLIAGAEWPFMIAAGVEVIAWVPRAGHLTLELREFMGDVAHRVVTVCPGVERAYDVIAERVIIGETRTVEAALTIALDHLCAPLHANAQRVPDPCAV